MKMPSKKIVFMLISFAIFVGIQNFTRIDSDPIESLSQSSTLAKEDFLEKEVDIKLKTLEKFAASSYLAQKCFETRIVCVGNRSHEKCLQDKIHQYIKCSNISDKDALVSFDHLSF